MLEMEVKGHRDGRDSGMPGKRGSEADGMTGRWE